MLTKRFTISNLLILISIVFTAIWYFSSSFISEWWINNFYLREWKFFHYIIQIFSWTFIHSWITHLFMNSIFIYYFWNIIEIILWKTKYLIFFILFVISNWIILAFLNDSNVIWISWFAMAILTYYTLELKKQNNPEYKWWLTAIFINIAIWLLPWISMLWHINWVIFGIIFYFFNNDFFKRQLVWLFNYPKIETPVIKPSPLNTKKN